MNLRDLLSAYAREHDVAHSTIEQYGYALGNFERWLSRPAISQDLTDDSANAWLTWMLAKGLSRATVKGQRGSLLTLWRYAVECGLLDRLPLRVKLIRRSLPLPEAYSLVQLANILTAIAAIPGRFPCGTPRAALLRAWVLAAWYTALRPCDLYQLRWSEISPDGVFVVAQQKTGEAILRRLPADALAAIVATNPEGRARVFPMRRKTLAYWWGKIRTAANVKGSPKWMRRASATAVEKIQRGSAMGHLGHRTPGLAYRHYVDMRQLEDTGPMPPRIADGA